MEQVARPTRCSSRPVKVKRMQDFIQYSSSKIRKKDKGESKANQNEQTAPKPSSGSIKNDKADELNKNKTKDTNTTSEEEQEDKLKSLDNFLNKNEVAYELKEEDIRELSTMITVGTNTLSDDEEYREITATAKSTILSNSRNIFKCDVCLKYLSSKDSLSRHLYRHTGQKPHKCDICNTSFSMKSYLDRHMQRHTKERSFICEICGKGFGRKATLDTHMLSHTDKKEFACDQCDKTFKQRHSLVAHQNMHAPDKMWICHQCGKSFSCKNYLTQHLKTHSGTSSFKCEQCDKTFQSKQTLDEHCRRHIGEKIVTCQICPKKFYNKKELAKHMKFHNQHGDYKCEPCKMYFKGKKNLYIHNMKIHSTQYTCTDCDLIFTSKRIWQSHVKKKHGTDRKKLDKYETANFKKMKCVLCNKVLSNKYRLQKHFLKKHGLNKPVISHIYYEDGTDFVEFCSVDNLVGQENHEQVIIENGEMDDGPMKDVVNNPSVLNLDINTAVCIDNCGIDGGTPSIPQLSIHTDSIEAKDRPIIFIVEEAGTAESSEPHVLTVVDANNSNEHEEATNHTYQDVFIPPGPESENPVESYQSDEVLVLVNDVDENCISETGEKVYKTEDTNTAAYNEVDHEVIIQPDNSVVVCINTSTDNQQGVNLSHAEESSIVTSYSTRYHNNQTITQFADGIKDTSLAGAHHTSDITDNSQVVINIMDTRADHVLYDTIPDEKNTENNQVVTNCSDKENDQVVGNYSDTENNQVVTNYSDKKNDQVVGNYSETGNNQGVTNYSDTGNNQVVYSDNVSDIDDNTNATQVVTNYSEKNTNTTQVVTNHSDKNTNGMPLATKYSDRNNKRLPSESHDNLSPDSCTVVEKTDKAEEFPHAADVERVLHGVSLLCDSKEEFTNFEHSLFRGIKSLRKLSHYGQFLDNILEFVEKEQKVLNLAGE